MGLAGWLGDQWREIRRRGWSRRRRAVAALVLLATLVLLPVGSAALALRLADAGDASPLARTRGGDGVWLGHAWVDGRKGPADLAALPRLLRMGLPAFYADEWGHRGSAETVAAAVRGVRLGLSRHAPDRPNFGVAMYADFSASAADWAAYRTKWCQDLP